MRRDGSLYKDRNCFWRTFCGEVFAFILIAVFITVITLFVLIDPFSICDPYPPESRAATEPSAKAF